MSYSRWINSDFYTYWMSTGRDKGPKSKNDEQFVCHSDLITQHIITYDQAKDYLVDREALQHHIKVDERDAIELQSYLKQWIKDVDRKFTSDEQKQPQ